MRVRFDPRFLVFPALVMCVSLLISCQYYGKAKLQAHVVSPVQAQQKPVLTPEVIGMWLKGSVPLRQWGNVIAFSNDESVAIVGQGAVLLSLDNASSWKTLDGGKGSYRSTVDGGDTYRNTDQLGGSLPTSVNARKLCSAESAVLTTSGRLYVKTTCEHTTQLWSIPTRSESDEWNVVSFTYETDPLNGVYSPGHNLTVVGDRVLIDAALPSGAALLTTDNNGASWYPLWRGSADDAGIVSFSFINERLGWMLEGNGTLLKTADGGRTWEHLARLSPGWARKSASLDFADSQTGFIVGRDGLLLTTTDAGRTWQQRGATTTLNLYKVAAVDAKRVWAVGEKGTVLETSDGGVEWRRIDLGIEKDIRFGLGVKGGTAWVVSEGLIFHSSKG